MNKQYRDYLQSPEWAEKKRACIERSKINTGSDNQFGVCERCGYKPWKPILQVHHLTYERIFNEDLEDLLLICPSCHKQLHKEGKVR